ncbi:N-acetylmuramoyl-L-alanine amidase [Pseudosulfitobacter pseudonitzschiae]|uniref:N-acetylmuramoyl-L-alanine amidase n=1 Tax=Pseudosulfitobacter pseudonitzschiae TaxID=1402135 RepID=UPI001AF6E237|nr:N-acetylmuramoyl-L-alanine amidase [Pseudosulfitobacter pseudonitzschiae]MBM1813843.1 N-acetylmuramoyl-L-alanine amidase [Pseudosulfitobacter pseudonitzschiae]MBM1830836.1 N-acetylmuramoyl-L-alanine amidase [Pseudosulfitobacter pseudonitzschiae]MBM1835703.1 N-acetylmuramoyl-L-alanine amidase [Pseudosulfitobacter pseudonitzschiae]MBM1840549.1 N-acetylmuramoyl-L-alanine amidase [Pseudosulfitobacter pseudonitzschiae]MBM1845463.1 N-acetylmuramoyl-L-alanine amidase [Pseudosulfitobacter pseudonit
MQIHSRPSPNCGPRRDGLVPELVVIHFTAMHSADAALERLCDPQYEVSAHYLIAEDGTVTQLVPEHLRAWHAGAGHWAGRDDVNSRSIGIELDNDGQRPFAEAQMQNLMILLRDILDRWSIPAQGVIGHSDMAPDRKFDPGPHFDWPRLEAAGLAAPRGTGSGPDDPTPETFRAAARAAGYTADVTDDALLNAVRLRYRPDATGPLTPDDYIPLHLAR